MFADYKQYYYLLAFLAQQSSVTFVELNEVNLRRLGTSACCSKIFFKYGPIPASFRVILLLSFLQL